MLPDSLSLVLATLGLAVMVAVWWVNRLERRRLEQLNPVRREPTSHWWSGPASTVATARSDGLEELAPNELFEWPVFFRVDKSQGPAWVEMVSSRMRCGSKPMRFGRDGALWVSLLLCTRQGPLSLSEHTEFVERVFEIGKRFGARPEGMKTFAEAHGLSRDAERTMSDLDGQLAFHLVTDSPPSLEAISSAWRQCGLQERGEGRFSMVGADSEVQFSVLPGDQGRLCSLLLDLPRASEPVSVLDSMFEVSDQMAAWFDAELVDDRDIVLSRHAQSVIREQVKERADALASAGLLPGGPLSRLVFQ